MMGVENTMYFQPGTVSRIGNHIDYGGASIKWFAAPVLCYKREKTMLDFVPFACAGRKMTYMNHQSGFIGKPLDLVLPQSDARSIAAATIGFNQQGRGAGISLLSNLKKA